ncbi:hypothetical protein ACVMB1_004034 [Bradyrhizobium sp. USDA 4504]
MQPANAPTSAPWSRSGVQRITPGSGPQAARMAILVGEPGLDIYAAHLIWAGGSTSANVAVNTLPIGTVSMSGSIGPGLVQDQEVGVIYSAVPGLHLLEYTQGSGLSIGVNYVRSRSGSAKFSQRVGSASGTPYGLQRKPVLQNLEAGPGSNVVVLFDEVPTSRVVGAINIEIKATLQRGQGFIIHGCWSAGLDPSVNDGKAVPGVIIYLEASGGALVAVNPSGGHYAVSYRQLGCAAPISSFCGWFWRVGCLCGRN